MLRPTYFVVFVLQASLVFGQSTFNRRMDFGFPASVLTSILATDSCYYSTGLIADTLPPFRAGNLFVKLDLEGVPEFAHTITDTLRTYETWEHTLFPSGDGFVVSGYSFDSTMKGFLLKYAPNGSLASIAEYLNPLYPSQEYIRPMSLHPYLSGGFVMANWIGNGYVDGYADNGIQILRTDSLGSIIWEKPLNTNLSEFPKSISIDDSGNIILGGLVRNSNLVDEDYTYQVQITSLDSLGNENWTYLTPTSLGLRDAANDMVLLGDGSLVIASGVGHEQERASVNVVYFEKHIFKLNPQHEIEWELTFPDGDLTGSANTSKLLQLSDGSGFVMAGTAYEKLTPPVYFTIQGWLAKVSPVGDSVWTRRYNYLTDTPNEHMVYDMKETPDGGLILCGESRDWGNGATYPQQAWLLKLDQHGCLVPGCHLLDAIEGEEMPELELAIYPNPTADYLNFELRGGFVGRTASFRITDLQGRVLRTFESATPGATHMVPVWDWGAGVYFLQYVDEEGRASLSEKFIVTK